MRAALTLALWMALSPVQAQTMQNLPAMDSYSQTGLAAWQAGFKTRALAAGIPAALFDAAFQGVQFLPDVVEKDRKQDEFTRTIWDYLDRAVSDDRIATGQRMAQSHADLLAQIEARYGVDRYTVLAIWGLESAYGAVRGDIPTLSALASLAYEGRRAAFFEGEVLALLQTLAEGRARLDQLRGSWAGAMGHTQFMPSSYRALAVDFDGGDAANIWDDDPSDALASTAAYLAKSGWQMGLPWAVEVVLPPGFDYEIAGNRTQRPPSAWAAMGVARADGGAMPDAWGAVILPAGARGPAFWISDNFAAIETYNRADSYVIAVGHLSDRLRGLPPLAQPWPRDLRALTVDERRALQQKLLNLGLYTGEADGKIGPLTIAAIKSLQRRNGRIPDGYASVEVLETME